MDSTEEKKPTPPAPGIIYPRCPFCPPADPRPDGTRPGDPFELMRLRHDFADGVVVELLYCADCRAVFGGWFAGFVQLPEPKK